jgi:serine/threonine protein kinase
MTHTMQSYIKQCVLNELRILSTHECPYIVIFKEAFMKSTNTLYLVTEFASGGDLQQLLKRHALKQNKISENTVWHIFLQVSIAVDYLHKLNVLHRDLKPANVLLDDHENVKLADMGIVKILRNSGYGYTQIGTPLYMSPEILRRERYGPKSDAWALGCILYELLYLKPAFESNSIYVLRNKIVNGDIYKYLNNYSADLNDILSSLLKVHLRSRLDVSGVLGRPSSVRQLTMRHFQQSRCMPEVKELFYKVCVPPERLEDWRVVVDKFCDLNHTIQMSESSHKKIALIKDIRSKLDKKKIEGPKNLRMSYSRVLPANGVFKNKVVVKISDYENKILILRKQISDYEKIIAHLKKQL